ncbi:GLUG motif-containing protein [Natronolimnobius sp. AArcel1]|uniref:GLUG motif-containing protein n=1 Tax=Natronolimnobius sp. AArcel1 TaxID=1679093 RepID=UPI0019D00C73|nr:GLUG motif-containing protein [Natronolimnobius sp. AArcel1]
MPGDEMVGGFVGLNSDSGEVVESYATGDVEGDSQTGGLVGQLGIDNSIAESGPVLRDSYVVDDAGLDSEDTVIGEIVEGDGDGDVVIEHGEETLADDGETFVEDIEQELIDEFIRSEGELPSS